MIARDCEKEVLTDEEKEIDQVVIQMNDLRDRTFDLSEDYRALAEAMENLSAEECPVEHAHSLLAWVGSIDALRLQLEGFCEDLKVKHPDMYPDHDVVIF